MDSDEMIEILEALIRDPDTNPTARCTAIRTLREIQAQEAAERWLRRSGRIQTAPPPSQELSGEFVELTASQWNQLQAFIEEQDTSEERVNLRPAQNLPSSYIETVLLDEDGEPTSTKRVLFP